MKVMDVRDGSLDLPALLAQVEGGDEVLIARDGIPVARVVGCQPSEQAVLRDIPQAGSWRSLPGWENFVLDESVFAPMTDTEMEEEGWI